MSTDNPRTGYTPIYKDGETRYVRPGVYEGVWKPQGWSLQPPPRRARRQRQRPVTLPVVEARPNLPMPRPRVRDDHPPGLTLNLTPAQMGRAVALVAGVSTSVALVLHQVF